MDEFTKKQTGETRAQYVLRLASQNNNSELAPKVSEPKTSTNTDNDGFDIQNLSPMKADSFDNNQPNTIIIEQVSQIDPGPDRYEYVKSLDDNDLQELSIINNNNYCEDSNSSLTEDIILQEPLNIINMDVQKMVKLTEPNADNNVTEENKFITLQNVVEIPIIDSFIQGNNENFSIIQEQEMRHDIDEEHSISTDSNQGSTYFLDENEISGSSDELTLSENNEEEEERGENKVETQETRSDSDNDNSVKKRTRKVLRKPETWKRAVAKKRRNEGLEYLNVKKKIVKSRKVGSPCSNKCRLKCSTRLTQEQRKEIHKRFWKIGDIHRQRDYFLQCMDPINPKYRMHTPSSNRSKNYAYHFEVEGERTRVCKSYYLKTLDISNKLIFTATKKKDGSGILQPDMRGKHKKGGKKVTDDIKEDIRKSFPTMPNIASMYRLYKANCEELNKPCAKQSMYETIFNTEFNIAFYTPKKDQCMTCESLKNCTEAEKELKQAPFGLTHPARLSDSPS